MGTKLPTSTSQAPLLNSEYRLWINHGWEEEVLVFLTHSPTMMPVTSSGTRSSAFQRRKTVSQLYQTFNCWKLMGG